VDVDPVAALAVGGDELKEGDELGVEGRVSI
jgi:hypothetical protein